jgi:hypothetical protein
VVCMDTLCMWKGSLELDLNRGVQGNLYSRLYAGVTTGKVWISGTRYRHM